MSYYQYVDFKLLGFVVGYQILYDRCEQICFARTGRHL